MAGNQQQETTSYSDRIAAMIVSAVCACIILWFNVPFALQTWRVDTAIRCGDTCLTKQDAEVLGHGDESNGRTHDLRLRLQSGKVVHARTQFAILPLHAKGKIVTVKTYSNQIVFVDNQYAYRSWSEYRFFSLLFAPTFLLVLLLLLPKIGDRRVLPRGAPSIATTAFVGAAVAMLAGFMGMFWTHLWQIPMVICGVSLTLIGYAIGRMRMRSRRNKG